MPYYGRKGRRTTYRRRPTGKRNYRKKTRVAVKKTVRIPLATRRQVWKLSKQVRYNTRQALGDLQKNHQRFVNTGPVPHWPSLQTPVAIFHQGLQNLSSVFGLAYVQNTPPVLDTLTPGIVGAWQDMDLNVALGGNFGTTQQDHDQLKTYASSYGVQSKFVHYHSMYTFSFTAVQAVGYVQIDLIETRRNYTRTLANELTVREGLAGFAAMCKGGPDLYCPNPSMYKKRMLYRHYFNTALTDDQLHTNPNAVCTLMVKNPFGKKLILTTQNDLSITPGVIEPSEVPLRQQMWLIVSCSIPASQISPTSHIKWHCTKQNIWRDWLGQSH